jgi:transposase
MKPCGRGGDGRRREQLERENRHLRQQLQRALGENERLKQEHARLKQEIERLRRQLEEALRAAKRQAAPFSRGQPQTHPKPPGRKAGEEYGPHHCRPFPRRVDERIAVPLPSRCPGCGGQVAFERTAPQYQEDIVRRTLVRRFDVAVGRCQACGQRVQGRHPLQASDALGAAQVQLGPEALALAAELNKQMGLSLGHTAEVLKLGFGFQVSRAGLYRALARMAAKAQPTYQALIRAARASLVNGVDETGWRVGGRLQWMWVAVSAQVTVYMVLPGRGFAEAALLLGTDYSGWLVHDGLRCYYGFELAFHQSCLAHPLRRCRDLVQVVSPSAARFPLQVRSLLEKALALRDRYQQGEISLHGLWTAAGRLEAHLDRLLARPWRSASNRRLAAHLRHEQPHLLTFLRCPGLEATNNAAERALRGVVIARKVWGGNRTWNGARTQGILASVLRTCRQQGQDAFALLVGLLRSPAAQVLDIVPSGRSP